MATCFFLGEHLLYPIKTEPSADESGTTFTHWVVDHNVLWANPTTPKALDRAITYYALLASAPDGMGWAYIALGVSAILSAASRLSKGMRGGESEVLFDGGSVGTSWRYVLLDRVFSADLRSLAGRRYLCPSLQCISV